MFDLPAKNDKIVTMIGDLQWKSDGLEMMSNAAELEQHLLEKIQSVEATVQTVSSSSQWKID